MRKLTNFKLIILPQPRITRTTPGNQQGDDNEPYFKSRLNVTS